MADPLRAEITDAVDPEGRGRVRVRCPALSGQWESWAPVLRPDPAAPVPAYARGDVVMLLFEGGDPAAPVVLGTLSVRDEPAGAALPAGTRRGLAQLLAATPGAALFSGPSGTGKTMAAQVVAKELGRALVAVDLAQVASKYIGETEKNLDAILSQAEASGAVLLFDEADALFGKRGGVRDSNDRHANVEIGYLLQWIEAYSGLVILTTNCEQDLDPAFLQRLAAILRFPMSDAGLRG